ncbi:unnamed protein product [Clonostachys rosea f. rosea IK726]|uniref:Formamidopyrimidine-DNA glycosylase catalytic domain-containing protein n=2 Tax=Bionectria ochroleuca TaxID=29856 RepID=A0A0B7JT03_BIOOC|nr:unnamed protein product [Clonostachys rosea f. rosea IK726]
MPEIAEVARIVHFLKLTLVGKRITQASAIDDSNVFGKVGTTGADVAAALKGKKASLLPLHPSSQCLISESCIGHIRRLTLEKPPHLVMHFGMTGWVHIRGEKTAYTNYYKKMKESDLEQWPPKFWKFQITTEGDPEVEVAFTDARRFGRVRLVDCPGDDIRKHSPLVENGPDPVVDKDRFTEEYLQKKMKTRHVPIKALLLDQTMISGIGNWVADETLYQAKIQPEQYCDDFNDEEINTLYQNIRYVCQTAVDKLGDSDEFPDHWLFNYRWGKGAKDTATKLPNGEKLAFITVGGRTSCYAPGVQKKTGRVAPGVKEETVESAKKDPPKKGPVKKEAPKPRKPSRKAPQKIKDEEQSGESDAEPPKKKIRSKALDKAHKKPSTVPKEIQEAPVEGRRRSTRLSGKSGDAQTSSYW